MEAANELLAFRGIACNAMVGRSSVINGIITILPHLADAKEVMSDTCDLNGREVIKLKGDKFPIDCAVLMDGNAYFIVKGKTIFGSIGEIEGFSLAERIISNIRRNYL